MNPYHYDEPLPRRTRPMLSDRLLAVAALALAVASLVVALLT